MINMTPKMRTAIVSAGSVAAARYRARQEGQGNLVSRLGVCILREPGHITKRCQSGCRIVDSAGVEYLWTDLGHLVRMDSGVTVNLDREVDYPAEVRSTPVLR